MDEENLNLFRSWIRRDDFFLKLIYKGKKDGMNFKKI
jgi:hypothetical protein